MYTAYMSPTSPAFATVCALEQSEVPPVTPNPNRYHSTERMLNFSSIRTNHKHSPHYHADVTPASRFKVIFQKHALFTTRPFQKNKATNCHLPPPPFLATRILPWRHLQIQSVEKLLEASSLEERRSGAISQADFIKHKYGPQFMECQFWLEITITKRRFLKRLANREAVRHEVNLSVAIFYWGI